MEQRLPKQGRLTGFGGNKPAVSSALTIKRGGKVEGGDWKKTEEKGEKEKELRFVLPPQSNKGNHVEIHMPKKEKSSKKEVHSDPIRGKGGGGNRQWAKEGETSKLPRKKKEKLAGNKDLEYQNGTQTRKGKGN